MKKNKPQEQKSKTYDFDLVVIGSGPAGIAAAMQAAKLEKKVAIVEKSPDKIGGAWLHTGTIPSKSIREVLAALQNVKPHMGQHWVTRLVHSLSSDHLVRRAQSVSEEEECLVRKHLESNNIEVLRGLGRIEDRHTIRLISTDENVRLVSCDKILVATGSSPRRPPEIPFDGWRVLDSDDIIKLETLPQSIVIYGAGVIGCEYACIFGALGVDTTIVDARSQVMQTIDREVTQELKQSMESLGVRFLMGAPLAKIRCKGSEVLIELQGHSLKAEVCFFAAGRVSTTKNLGLERVGIETNDRGAIVVNDHFQTKMPNIYAAGDAIGPPALASTSLEQGRIAVSHAFKQGSRLFPKVFPIGIYTIPELSSVGKSEEELQAEGISYVVGRADYEEIARGYIRGDVHGLLKILVATDSEQLLGIHIVGSDACNLIHIGQCCMMAQMPLRDLVDSMIFNYPTLAEAYRVAAFNAVNQLGQKPDQSQKDPSAA